MGINIFNINTMSTFGIFKILKEIYVYIGITAKSIKIVDCFIRDMLDKITQECISLTLRNDKKIINIRVVQTSILLTLPGELGLHSIHSGIKSLNLINFFS